MLYCWKSKNSKFAQKFLPVLCFALSLSPASRLGKNSNLLKSFSTPPGCWSGVLLDLVERPLWRYISHGPHFFPAQTFHRGPELRGQKFVCTELLKMHLDVCSWSGLFGSLGSFFSTEPVAINLVEAFKERICQPVSCFTFSLCSAMRLYHQDKFSKNNMSCNKSPAYEFVVLLARWV